MFTENDISDLKREQEVLSYSVQLIQQAIETCGVTLDELTEIILNVDSSRHWHYYFVDHTHRLLFWVESVSVEVLKINLQGVTEYSHISIFNAPLPSSTDSYVFRICIWLSHVTGMHLLLASRVCLYPLCSILALTLTQVYHI